jgi:hypothetical protein
MNIRQEVGERVEGSRNEGHRLQWGKVEIIHEEADAISRTLKEPPTTSRQPSKRKCVFM